MQGNLPSGMFITGVDTEVGKTYVSSLLAREFFSRGIRVGVYKPVASGCVRGADGQLVSDDAMRLWQAAGCPASLDRVCPLRYELPVAPSTAARLLGESLPMSAFIKGAQWWTDQCDRLLVEGAGGWLSPLGDDCDNRQFAAALGYPIVLVAENRLGVIHQVRATYEAIIRYPSFPFTVNAILLSQPRPPTSTIVRWPRTSLTCNKP